MTATKSGRKADKSNLGDQQRPIIGLWPFSLPNVGSWASSTPLLSLGSVLAQGVTRVERNGTVIGRAVKSWRNLFKDAYLAELEHFIECVQQGRQPRVTGHDGLKAVEAVVAANQSILQGTPVDIAG